MSFPAGWWRLGHGGRCGYPEGGVGGGEDSAVQVSAPAYGQDEEHVGLREVL